MNRERERQYLTPGTNYIYVFWHSKTFLIVPHYRGNKIGILTLLDFKNLLYSKMCDFLGYQTVPVTTEARAAIRMKQLLEKGYRAAIALDGPKGPAGSIRLGALFLSQKTDVPIVAIKVHCKKSFRLRSRWDQYEIPYPFSEASIILSEPMRVTSENSSQVEQRLKDFLGEYKH